MSSTDIEKISPVGSDDQNDKLPVELTDIKMPDLVKAWYKYPHMRMLYWGVFLVTLTSTNNGYDSSILNGLQSLDSWKLAMSHPTGHILGALSNGNTFGVILSVFFAQYLADTYGRRLTILIGEAICIIGAILTGVSYNYAFFLCARIVIGFGSGIALVGSPSLITEIAYPNHRETATAFYNVCWFLGAIVAAWVTYGTRVIDGKASWTIPSFLQGIFPLVQVVFIYYIPESPRFHVSKGNIERAREFFVKYHFGGSQDPADVELVELEIKEIQQSLEMEKLASTSSYMDFVKIPSFRRRIFLCLFVSFMMQLSGNGLISFYLNKVLNSIDITSEKKQLEINGCLMIYNFVIAGSAASIIGRYKRRTVFLTCSLSMMVCFIIWTALSAQASIRDYPKSYSNGVLAFIFLFDAAYAIGLNGLPYVYVCEILPYSHRAKGLNVFQFSQMLIIIFNGFVNPIAMDAIDWKYYIVYCVVEAVEFIVVYFTFPETSGLSLEAVQKVFEENTNFIVQLAHPKAVIEHMETV